MNIKRIDSDSPEWDPATASAIAVEQARYTEWIDKLRADGVACAMVNGAAIDPDEMVLSIDYPFFNDGVQVGSLVVLAETYDKFLVVRLTRRLVRFTGQVSWAFEVIQGSFTE